MDAALGAGEISSSWDRQPMDMRHMSDLSRVVIVGGRIAWLLLATQLGQRLARSGPASVNLVDNSSPHILKLMKRWSVVTALTP